MTREELLQVAKPILFNTEMVEVILAGRKTVTRRVVKGDIDTILNSPYHKENPEVSDKQIISKLCAQPYQTGDILYVRETWDNLPVNPDGTYCGYNKYYYRADGDMRPEGWKGSWRPSIHMLKEAARIFLKVTDVRVERLQEIDDKGVLEEGLEIGEPFDELWDSTCKKNLQVYGWDANPWVWVIKFERVAEE